MASWKENAPSGAGDKYRQEAAQRLMKRTRCRVKNWRWPDPITWACMPRLFAEQPSAASLIS
jgi:hypothetical protein